MIKYVLFTIVLSILLPFLRHLMSSAPAYQLELQVAQLAVKRALVLTKALSDHIATTRQLGTQIKDDKLPVTVGDYAAQAIVNHAIKKNFPNDEIVGEEDLVDLKADASLSKQVFELIQKYQQSDKFSDVLGSLDSEEEVFK